MSNSDMLSKRLITSESLTVILGNVNPPRGAKVA